jgi:cytochrome c oxidase subunit 2
MEMKTVARAFSQAAALAAGGVAWTWSRTALAFPPNAVGLPYDASEDGHDVDSLIKSTGVLIGLLFVAMVVWLVYACVVHNSKKDAKYDHGDSKRAVRTTLGIAAAIFLIVDGNLFINSEIDLNKIFWNFQDVETKADTVRIEINAHQWAWDARYAGPDGKFNTQDDIVSLNDLHVPVGRPITFQLASTDVIHSFYLPNFRVKQDAVPGMINRLWFRPKETGTFEIGCAQHCGVNHYKMRAVLTVDTPEDYARWASEASARGARGYDPKDAEAHWGWEWKARE